MTKVLIIEDEQPAAKRLIKILAEVAPQFEIIHVCDSIESSVHFFKSGIKPDLIFLDVQLGDGVSFEIFKEVEVISPIIFTTAYDEYAIRAFELNSIDYLMKPIHKEALERSVDKFNKLKKFQQTDLQVFASLLDKENRDFKLRFLVNVGENLLSVKTSEIAYFYSIDRSTYIVTQSGRNYSVEHSLEKLETLLSPKDFFRINRQFIASFQSIKKITILSKSRIKLILEPASTEEVFVSNARAHEFRIWLDR
jgi:DNA-binding LytR/AlgR family response regulator